MQLIQEKGGDIVSCYTIEDAFIDFCTGPHIPSTEKLKAFKVLHSSNAYWKGDAQNQPMQRIYGTAFFKESELKKHLYRLSEAKKRDHRKLGKELGLFTFHHWAPGAPFWHAKGTTLYQTLADYMRRELSGEGYQEVRTPLVFNKQLWETSGHWEHYRENMFQIDSEGESFALKAMNCPAHMLMFASEGRSYRDLPLRFHDQGVLHRQEASGVVSGLTRVRQLSQDDAHCFITEEQISEEVERLLRLIRKIYGDFQLDYKVELSTRPEHYIGTVETWDHAEQQLKSALDAAKISYSVSDGDGSFYGPKIDFFVPDALGREWQLGTIQLDFSLPERFDLEYVAQDGSRQRPVVLHKAMLGSLERFMGVLIEHYAGTFPVWLSPVQAVVIPITDRNHVYAQQIKKHLESTGIRVQVDLRNDRMNSKIRDAQLQKIPYMLVVGDREAEQEAVAVRLRSTEKSNLMTIGELTKTIIAAIDEKM